MLSIDMFMEKLYNKGMRNLLKQPTAWIPLIMSVVAFSLVVATVSFFGAVRQADEGTAAHLFQLLLVGQLPLIGYFAFKWFPRKQKDVFFVLVLQAIAGIVALSPVFIFGL